MTKTDEKKIRSIVQDELLGIINDGREFLDTKKDPMGLGRKALSGLTDLIRQRQAQNNSDKD